MLRTATLIAGLLLAGAATAAPYPDYPVVDDVSFTEPSGHRVIQQTVEVPAPADQVWAAWTTAEGWRSFAVPVSWVDFRVGGMIESSYTASAKPGDANNIRNEIIAYVPGRMLAMRTVQTPLKFEDAAEFMRTATVIEIIPIDAARTRVVLTGTGFAPGAAYDRLYPKFRWGDAFTLDKLRKRFVDGPVDWSKPG